MLFATIVAALAAATVADQHITEQAAEDPTLAAQDGMKLFQFDSFHLYLLSKEHLGSSVACAPCVRDRNRWRVLRSVGLLGIRSLPASLPPSLLPLGLLGQFCARKRTLTHPHKDDRAPPVGWGSLCVFFSRACPPLIARRRPPPVRVSPW